MDTYDREKEIQEALAAGDEAIRCLQRAKDELGKAGGWGFVDMFGGGLISTMLKHGHINQASAAVDAARQALWNYSREISDVREAAALPDVQVDGFLTFADYFMDGFIADYLVQTQIEQAKKDVSAAIWQVGEMQGQLRGLKL